MITRIGRRKTGAKVRRDIERNLLMLVTMALASDNMSASDELWVLLERSMRVFESAICASFAIARKAIGCIA